MMKITIKTNLYNTKNLRGCFNIIHQRKKVLTLDKHEYMFHYVNVEHYIYFQS
jgi:hypothetical protein